MRGRSGGADCRKYLKWRLPRGYGEQKPIRLCASPCTDSAIQPMAGRLPYGKIRPWLTTKTLLKKRFAKRAKPSAPGATGLIRFAGYRRKTQHTNQRNWTRRQSSATLTFRGTDIGQEQSLCPKCPSRCRHQYLTIQIGILRWPWRFTPAPSSPAYYCLVRPARFLSDRGTASFMSLAGA